MSFVQSGRTRDVISSLFPKRSKPLAPFLRSIAALSSARRNPRRLFLVLRIRCCCRNQRQPTPQPRPSGHGGEGSPCPLRPCPGTHLCTRAADHVTPTTCLVKAHHHWRVAAVTGHNVQDQGPAGRQIWREEGDAHSAFSCSLFPYPCTCFISARLFSLENLSPTQCQPDMSPREHKPAPHLPGPFPGS